MTRVLADIKDDLVRAISALKTAEHYLDETGAYESFELDEVCGEVNLCIARLEAFIDDKEV